MMRYIRIPNNVIVILLYIFSDLFCVSPLHITQDKITINRHDSFIVTCNDAGQPVEWRNPKGKTLGMRTRPYTQSSNYGLIIRFDRVRSDEAGTYTCSSKNGEKQLRVKVADLRTSYENRQTDEIRQHTDTSNNQKPQTNKYPNRPSSRPRNRVRNKPEPIRFMGTPDVQTGIQGDRSTLLCDAKGATVSWVNEDGELLPEPKFKMMGDGLVIENTEKEDAGVYICRAIQESTGIIKDKRITFLVEHEPSYVGPVYAEQEIVWGFEGSFVNLTCEVTAHPTPTFRWSRNDRQRILGHEIQVSPVKYVLEIEVSEKTLAEYLCTVQNRHGKLKKWYKLEMGLQPYPPGGLNLIEATSDTLVLEILPPNTTEKIEEVEETTPEKGDEAEEEEEEEEGTEEDEENLEEKRRKRETRYKRYLKSDREREDRERQERERQTEDEKISFEPTAFYIEYKLINEENQTDEWSNEVFNITEENSYTLIGLEASSQYEVRVASQNIAGLSNFTETYVFETSFSTKIYNSIVYTVLSTILTWKI